MIALDRSSRDRRRFTICPGECAQVRALLRRLLGRIDTARLDALARELPGASVELGVYRGNLCLDFSDPPQYRYRGVVRVVRQPRQPILVVDSFHIHQPAHRGSGLGLRVFTQLLSAARRLDIVRIETTAGRQADENGYYTWPRYGFAGRLPDPVRRRLPPELAAATDVLELMRSQAGRHWWRRFGISMRLAFDVRPGSPSRRAFARYYRERQAAEYRG